ncbi:OmpA family protein [Candidatus Poribacteria bacterium]|nr:OmpA family protein [Candidatus Poribacteria bacterium]
MSKILKTFGITILALCILTSIASASGELKVMDPKTSDKLTSLSLDMSPGKIVSKEIVVVNTTKEEYSIHCEFDPWMHISPVNFQLTEGEAVAVLVVFFIPKGEDVEREGYIFFKDWERDLQTFLPVKVRDPNKPPAFDQRNVIIEKLKNDVDKKDQEIGKLKENLDQLNKLNKDMEAQIAELNKSDKEKSARIASLMEHSKKLEKQVSVLENKSIDTLNREKVKRLKPIYTSLIENFASEIEGNEIWLNWDDERINFTVNGRILFESGKMYPKTQGSVVLEKLGRVLKRNILPGMKITIKGHADSDQIAEEYKYVFPSNWELSLARAASALRILQYRTGIESRYLSVTGASFYEPLVDNITPEARSINRRIEVYISLSDEEMLEDKSDENVPVAVNDFQAAQK